MLLEQYLRFKVKDLGTRCCEKSSYRISGPSPSRWFAVLWLEWKAGIGLAFASCLLLMRVGADMKTTLQRSLP